MTESITAVNIFLQSIAGKNITKEHAKQFVLLLRQFATLTATQILMDDYAIGISVAKDDNYKHARFSVREVGTQQNKRRSKTVSKLPVFTLKSIHD